jgi:hypothetical protein
MRQQRGRELVSGLRRKIGQVESEGERIYYEVTGTGPPVVLCHGLGGNHAIWCANATNSPRHGTIGYRKIRSSCARIFSAGRHGRL